MGSPKTRLTGSEKNKQQLSPYPQHTRRASKGVGKKELFKTSANQRPHKVPKKRMVALTKPGQREVEGCVNVKAAGVHEGVGKQRNLCIGYEVLTSRGEKNDMKGRFRVR